MAALALGLVAAAPPPPYRFPNARILYQPIFVRASSARALTPTSQIPLLSLFGWTLGGVFIAEWRESPIGPYREVAVLSGLVARGLSIGAWASDILVTTPQAVESAREEFGLPARLGAVDFIESAVPSSPHSPSALEQAGETAVSIGRDLALLLKTLAGTAIPGVAEPAERLALPPTSPAPITLEFEADDTAVVRGWTGTTEAPSSADGNGIVLPSFSGCLPLEDGSETPLLRYPLTIGSVRHLRFRQPLQSSVALGASEELRAVLTGPRASPCIEADGTLIVAGQPTEVSSRK